ncbi:MAG: DUF3576 domain-containing protein [Roseobacter sp.]|jgi:hypothetical protein|nr:DUF3576 domain-containing protein [Roseobacter sp.]
MSQPYFKLAVTAAVAAALLAGCGGQSRTTTASAPVSSAVLDSDSDQRRNQSLNAAGEPTSIWDVFGANNQEQTVAVNKSLWSASLEVLNFLPVESVDPFTGVIVTGFGTPPGSGRTYRATILIDDPALDARSLNVSLQTRNGPASASAVRAVENAILSRARQLRIADNAL